jgi:steroid delta-isomerase-like uncharacterized protein
MASDNTLNVIQRYYAAFNRGDNEGMLELLADDVAHDVNQAERELGKAAFRAFLTRMQVCYREQLVDLVYCMSADGMRAATEYVVVGTYQVTDSGLPAATGQTYRLPGGAFFAIQGERITRVTNYYNLQDWLRQVGAT